MPQMPVSVYADTLEHVHVIVLCFATGWHPGDSHPCAGPFTFKATSSVLAMHSALQLSLLLCSSCVLTVQASELYLALSDDWSSKSEPNAQSFPHISPPRKPAFWQCAIVRCLTPVATAGYVAAALVGSCIC